MSRSGLMLRGGGALWEREVGEGRRDAVCVGGWMGVCVWGGGGRGDGGASTVRVGGIGSLGDSVVCGGGGGGAAAVSTCMVSVSCCWWWQCAEEGEGEGVRSTSVCCDCWEEEGRSAGGGVKAFSDTRVCTEGVGEPGGGAAAAPGGACGSISMLSVRCRRDGTFI